MEKVRPAFVVNIPADGHQFMIYVSNRSIDELYLVKDKLESELTALYKAFEYLEKHYPISVNMKKVYNDEQEIHLDRIKYITDVLKEKKKEKELKQRLAYEQSQLELRQKGERSPLSYLSKEDQQKLAYEQELLRQQEKREKEQARINYLKRTGFY